VVSITPANISRISKLRFNALAGYSRKPFTEVLSEELGWFEHRTVPILGTLVLDRTDGDFGSIIIGKDQGGKYRCVDIDGWYQHQDVAEIKLLDCLDEWARRPASDREQGGKPYQGTDVFTPAVAAAKMNAAFARLISTEGFTCARELIASMMPYFEDVDGNFAEQFQSTGFDSRFWELYLFALLTEVGFAFDRTYAAPDFMCKGIFQDIFVEAVTVNPTQQGSIITEPPIPTERVEIIDYFRNYMPIKWGSALTSKLRKEYWKLPHAQEKPIVLAIQDFHLPRSMTMTHSTLIPYLYGLEFSAYYDASEKLHVNSRRIYEHKWKEKNIESGFFYLANSEMISAVIQNPTATISKFNRMGRLAGFGSKSVRMLRRGFAFNPNPNAAVPVYYTRDVESANYRETWGEGLNVYHNPNARYPLDPNLFSECMNHRLEENHFVHNIPEFHPYTAETFIVSPKRIGGL
jgi:hypothetical protein